MKRIFLADVGRFEKGDIRDYPKGTWEGISTSAQKKLGAFSSPVDAAAQQHVKKGGKR
jgi:hypothetical protein